MTTPPPPAEPGNRTQAVEMAGARSRPKPRNAPVTSSVWSRNGIRCFSSRKKGVACEFSWLTANGSLAQVS